MLPQAPSGFSNYKRSKKLLVGAVGIEPDAHPVSTGGFGPISTLRRHQAGWCPSRNSGTCNKRATSSLSEPTFIRDKLCQQKRSGGGPGESRTPDQRFRKPLLYPSELQARE
jgi:hypothetical protein